ncbi:hypothetical protein ESOMN_v1c03610 [Williamsoniiplasma somnilux]|uniref:Uncharacterized protein n=1 Tax=Williamsoniiplasma somnilux TaxID=215578 RepID=A0A2K8P1G6_9MOLU|nr:hypothetical protein [Williamsoniiplasma somnilux]ATZ18743.1 hypothetical protein ESOMN_v1c03610 [Williamsoniiplasma somnilux]
MIISKESTIKSLFDQTIVKWFVDLVSERSQSVRSEFVQMTNELPILIQAGASDLEIESGIQSVISELKLLKNVEEIKIYCKKNEFNSNEVMFKNNQISFDTMTQFLQNGESVIKMMLKVQFGSTFAMAIDVIDKFEEVELKLGKETQLLEMEIEDLNYLLNKSLEKWLETLNEFISKNPNDIENIIVEFEQIKNSKTWEIKKKAIEIINRYLLNFKSQDIFANLTDVQDFNNAKNKDEIIIYSRTLAAVTSLKLAIDLAIDLNKVIDQTVN